MCLVSGQCLQQGESPVLSKVAVEGDDVGDTRRAMTMKLMASCLLEGEASAQIFRIVSDEVRKERACIDENALHRTYSCRSA
jgi:hypothetical protein